MEAGAKGGGRSERHEPRRLRCADGAEACDRAAAGERVARVRWVQRRFEQVRGRAGSPSRLQSESVKPTRIATRGKAILGLWMGTEAATGCLPDREQAESGSDHIPWRKRRCRRDSGVGMCGGGRGGACGRERRRAGAVGVSASADASASIGAFKFVGACARLWMRVQTCSSECL